MNEFLKGAVFYFINHLLNKLPSRRLRMALYSFLSRGNISKKAYIGLGVRILDIRNVKIGANSNINFESILDGRGGRIEIGENVDIAPQVNLWTLEHNPKDPHHASISGKVIIGDHCWLANRVTVLPNTYISENSILAAGALVKGEYKVNNILMGSKAAVVGTRSAELRTQITPIRCFR